MPRHRERPEEGGRGGTAMTMVVANVVVESGGYFRTIE